MSQYKYNDLVVCGITIIFFEIVLIYIAILFMGILLICGFRLIEIFTFIPWQVYVFVGGILVAMHAIFLIVFLCTKKICAADYDEITLSDGKEELRFSKEKIEIYYTKMPFILIFPYYECYGSTTIVLKDNKKSKTILLFPHCISRLKALGYTVHYEKFPRKHSKNCIHYFCRREYFSGKMHVEPSRVKKVYFYYDKTLIVSIDFETLKNGKTEVTHDAIGRGYRRAEKLMRIFPKEMFELKFLFCSATRRAKRHFEKLLQKGLITKEQYDSLIFSEK